MKQHRKCDSAKYKRRRTRERVGHLERMRIHKINEQFRARQRIESLDRLLAVKREKHKAQQALVNVLARRLYTLSPEHAAEARVKNVFEIFRVFAGMNRQLWR